MSDIQQGPDWWRASDGRWYPPETHPDHRPPAAPSPVVPSSTDSHDTTPGPASVTSPEPSGGPGPFWRRPRFLVIVAVVVIGAVAAFVFWRGDDEPRSEDHAAGIDEASDPGDDERPGEGSGPGASAAGERSGDSDDRSRDDEREDDDGPIADAKPAALDANPAIAVHGIDELPDGEPGKLSVIARAPRLESSGSLPVVVRNRTNRTVTEISVTGTARDSSGALVASGSDQGFNPVLVGPGEIAFGYVYFGGGDIPADATFELSGTAAEPGGSVIGSVDLHVEEHNRTGDSIVVMLRNDTSADVMGPMGLAMVCFDADGNPITAHRTYTDQDEAAPGATVSASFPFWGDSPCERYLLAGSGYDF